MTIKTFAAALACVSFITGCAQLAGVPRSEPFPDASLRKSKSAEHWNVIAGDVATETAALRTRPEFQDKPLYVVPSDDNSDFSIGFQSMLISKLVNRGLTVATKPAGAAQVKYEAQVVRHLAGQGDYQPGSFAALAGGIVVARHIGRGNALTSSTLVQATALVAGAEVLNAYVQLRSPTNTEVIITTSVIDNNRFLMRKTDVYYVEDVEGVMFMAPYKPQIKAMSVTAKEVSGK